MKRPAAKLIHEATNITYWAKHPTWDAGSDVGFGFRCLQVLPFSLHGALKQVFFKPGGLIAVGAESVVVANGSDKVDKFMFRYPGEMPLKTFSNKVEHEVGIVTHCLAGIALTTEVSTKPAHIFRWPIDEVAAVTQTQTRLDLGIHIALDLPAVAREGSSHLRNRTAKDLATMLKGTDELINRHGYYPDLSYHSGNLRRSTLDGSVTLVDVMPFYSDGSRLIGDSPPEVIPHIHDTIESYRDFVGQYGN